MSLGTGCGSLDKATQVAFWQTQLPVDYLDTTITQNVWEIIDADLSDGAPAKLWFIQVEQTNNGAAVEDIELEMTINGTVYTVTLGGIASDAIIWVYLNRTLSAGDFGFGFSTTSYTVGAAGMDGDWSIPMGVNTIGLIRTRQTTAVDVTSAQIEVNIVWDKLVVV